MAVSVRGFWPLDEPGPEPPKQIEHALLAEPITAWRIWKVHRPESVNLDRGALADMGAKWSRGENPFEGLLGARLAAVGVDAVWGRCEEARCSNPQGLRAYISVAPPSVPHESPAQACGCGIWAVKDDDMLAKAYWNYGRKGQLAFGRVQMWGRFYEHELGYRAQYARPVEIIVPDGDAKTVADLALFYGCEVRAGRAPAKPPVQDDLAGSYMHYLASASVWPQYTQSFTFHEALRAVPDLRRFPTLARAAKSVRRASAVKIEWTTRHRDVTGRPHSFSNYTQIVRTVFNQTSPVNALVEHLASVDKILEHGVPGYGIPSQCGGYRHYLGRDLKKRDRLVLRPLREPRLVTALQPPQSEWISEFSLEVHPA